MRKSCLFPLCCGRDLGCVDGYGTVKYFNVTRTLVRQGDSILFKCGATLQRHDDGELHSLLMDIKKSFTGSQKWDLSTNEEIQIRLDPDQRFDAHLHQHDEIMEVELTIMSKNGIAVCAAAEKMVE